MKDRRERLEALAHRGGFERQALAGVVAGLREEVEERRARWKKAGWIAAVLAAAATAAYKLFGRSSLSARIGRVASVASLLIGLGRAVGKFRKLW